MGNTLVSTASTVLIKNSIAKNMPDLAAAGSAVVPEVEVNRAVYTAPVREKPSGFGVVDSGGIKPITQDTAIDAEIVDVVEAPEGNNNAGGSQYTGPKKKKKKKKRG